MDGLLVVDKPVGPTSHEVVARVRRALEIERIGHTGTLDPAASGVLPLVLGRATRLARFLSGGDKTYETTIRLGVETNTYDAQGRPVGTPYAGPMPAIEAIARALDGFRGTFLQRPPAFSAKKVHGRRSYRIARANETHAGEAPPVPLAPVSVTASAIDLLKFEDDRVTLRVTCSAGFYIRSLAHDLGEQLGIGAHVQALRRTRCGDASLDEALPLDILEHDPGAAREATIRPSEMLPRLSAVTLSRDGARRAAHGQDLGPADIEAVNAAARPDAADEAAQSVFVRLVDPTGDLIGIATSMGRSGLLHPAVVLV